jgi:N6-L-threonylcarbamoyladenine synthase
MKDIYILAIETSCDETSAAIIKNGKECISLTILSQMDIHASFGGVVPEIASRLHTENITMVLEETLNKAKMKYEDIDAFAVTYAPGLLGSLLVGLEAAKTLAFIYNKPFITVNHLAGHIYANNLTNDLKFPLLALIVSGGHTELIIMEDDYKFKLLGSTLDDAIGETYDKVARVLDMPYPGGPNVEKLAALGKPLYELSKPMRDGSYNFSFSGLKSNIINLVHNEKQRGKEVNKENLARSFEETAIEEILYKVELALNNHPNIKDMLIAGGVSANKYLRSKLQELCNKYQVNLSLPDFIYCTDNAAMIGAAAYPLYLKKQFSSLNASVKSSEPLV